MRSLMISTFSLLTALAVLGCEKKQEETATDATTQTEASSEQAAAASGMPLKLTENRTLRVAIDPGYYPMEYTDAEGKVDGFDVQYIKALADHLKHDIQLVTTPYDRILADVAAGKVDLGISSLEIPPESGDVQYVEYFGMPQVLVAKSGRGLAKASDLAGKTVGTLALSAARVTFHARMTEGHVGKVRGYESEKTSFEALEREDVDAIVVHSPTAAERVKRAAGKLVSLGSAETDQPLGIAVAREKKAIADAVLLATIALKQNGTTDKLSAYWFGVKKETASH